MLAAPRGSYPAVDGFNSCCGSRQRDHHTARGSNDGDAHPGHYVVRLRYRLGTGDQRRPVGHVRVIDVHSRCRARGLPVSGPSDAAAALPGVGEQVIVPLRTLEWWLEGPQEHSCAPFPGGFGIDAGKLGVRDVAMQTRGVLVRQLVGHGGLLACEGCLLGSMTVAALGSHRSTTSAHRLSGRLISRTACGTWLVQLDSRAAG